MSAFRHCSHCLRAYTGETCAGCFPPDAEAPCADVLCPCQDGDPCNYEDDPATGTKGMLR